MSTCLPHEARNSGRLTGSFPMQALRLSIEVEELPLVTPSEPDTINPTNIFSDILSSFPSHLFVI